MQEYKIIEDILNRSSPLLYYKKINIEDIKLEERVSMKCFQCNKYNKSWTCPPKIPNIRYEKMFKEYENAVLVYCKISFDDLEDFEYIRRKSTNLLHKTLLKLEAELYKKNFPLATSFIGGSCKLCKDGCAKEECRLPQQARIPLEATGVNVLQLFKKSTGIEIIFPPQKVLFRVGLLFW
ncbi:DUF2284 domain-containing protein [Clostridium botulinum]|nr:DUF2284 domain-containing protein [Clostridium botulinum]NFI19282.1 DUF2284 domain-containing protein [Clostridium botulinum]NFI51959.1 DUF2284 domain-containing protein [Clostridium botulinum]NFL92648.1 DUF2284 domain-containing protein [Clostridium botulinum]NFN52208.1 DUF2284 domain-containing protein [Clostridium botulinum]